MNRIIICLFLLVLNACDGSESAAQATEQEAQTSLAEAPAGEAASPEDPALIEDSSQPFERLTLEQLQKDLDIPALSESWSGDLDGMEQRRVIRVLTVYGLGRYYLDRGQEKGLVLEMFKSFEQFINKRLGKKTIRVHVAFIPVARDELISGLIEGRGDIAAAGMTITPEREELIDFSAPTTRKLSEILVTGPSAPRVKSIEDLAGLEVYVRPSSSYRSSIDAINREFRQQGLDEIFISDASEHLEDEDLLEMVNAGLLDWAIVDSYKADIWQDVFENLAPRKDIVFREGGQLGLGIRENSPQLKSALNEFLKSHRQGTLKGNVLINRHYRDFDWAKNALAAQDFERFESVINIFEKYGNEYGFDYLIVAAQGYQESRLDQSARSRAGAIGIMQLLPSTAADKNVGIPDITTVEPNIHAGVKYMNFIRNRYFNDPEIDHYNQTLFALAAYNAGPARITKLRDKAAARGYNPNKWFDNVEVLAAESIGSETVKYVANIVKYYVAYRLTVIRQLQRAEQRETYGIDG
jgi:membrane-bound lytic murein transglycosylase MltF